MKIVIFALFICFSDSGFSQTSFCQKQESTVPCTGQNSPKFPYSKFETSQLEQYTWLKTEIESSRAIYEQKKNLYANMFRFLQKGKLDDAKLVKETQEEIDESIADFYSLHEIVKQAKTIEAKLNFCYKTSSCGPSSRLNLEEQSIQLNKAKSLLLIKRPLLSHKTIEDYFAKKDSSFLDEIELPAKTFIEDIIMSASQKVASNLLNRVNVYDVFLRQPIQTNDLPEEISDDLLSKFSLLPPPQSQKPFLCELESKKNQKQKIDSYVQMGIDTALFIAPMALGPWSRLGFLSLESATGIKLLKWGLSANEVKAAAWVGRASFSFLPSSLQYNELENVEKKCQQIEQAYIALPQSSQLKQLSECREEYYDTAFLTTLGILTSMSTQLPAPLVALYKSQFGAVLKSSTSQTPKIGSTLAKWQPAKNEWAVDFATMDQGHFTYMDLSRLSRVMDPKLKSVPDDYWEFVGKIYSERLNLTPDEIKGFIKSSQEMSSRTKLIVNSNASLGSAQNFNGGVGIVTSKSADELLPFEKALGQKVQRTPGTKVAEIVRLTVSKEADPEKLSKSLINQAAGVILQDPSIQYVYVFTSKIHGRLYRKLGVKADHIKPAGERDIVIQIKRSEIEKMLVLTGVN
jgi:hypothetical protein